MRSEGDGGLHNHEASPGWHEAEIRKSQIKSHSSQILGPDAREENVRAMSLRGEKQLIPFWNPLVEPDAGNCWLSAPYDWLVRWAGADSGKFSEKWTLSGAKQAGVESKLIKLWNPSVEERDLGFTPGERASDVLCALVKQRKGLLQSKGKYY